MLGKETVEGANQLQIALTQELPSGRILHPKPKICKHKNRNESVASVLHGVLRLVLSLPTAPGEPGSGERPLSALCHQTALPLQATKKGGPPSSSLHPAGYTSAPSPD